MKKTPDEIFETLYKTYPALSGNKDEISKAYSLMKCCAVNGGLIMSCGNGGSAADCEHITGELMKGFNLKRPLSYDERKKFAGTEGGEEIAKKLQKGIRAVSLVSQTGLISAFANDVDASLVYAQQVYAYASDENDLLIALTTSGNSLNILQAAKTAKAAGIKTLAVTGETGGKIAGIADVTVRLPANTPFETQEYTLPVYHALCAALEAELFNDGEEI